MKKTEEVVREALRQVDFHKAARRLEKTWWEETHSPTAKDLRNDARALICEIQGKGIGHTTRTGVFYVVRHDRGIILRIMHDEICIAKVTVNLA